ncbi:hypothetical protein N7E02_16315 [Aliirhizobium terrae]|uniref:hypothetical protein n=1 Tax=Terrirhizobium terrae TaxID=2926709 RepID=UPI0025791285|nr:hypothetical protein [Rhizobium sp. CC-CFT758]WJH41817.1 hypothetical protein N7E02_16315 [Rhizobium sp. CC-CFT758]
MKTVLIVAAVLGLTSSAALAECAGHKVTASNEVDKEFTTASIATTPAQAELKQAGQQAETAKEGQKATE